MTERTYSDRGFAQHQPIPAGTAYGGTVRVYESSSALAPRIWLAVEALTGERVTELGRGCVCGVWESHHVGARVQDCPGYTPEPDWTPADPDRIARLRAAMTEKEDHA